MKTQLIALTAAIAAAFASNANAETAAALPGLAPQPASYFYTGKPYDADLGAYVFAYRNYNPEFSRWTTADPSGFPDGSNHHRYVINPTCVVDALGLFSLTVSDSAQYDVKEYTDGNNNTFTVTPTAPIGIISGMSGTYQSLLNQHFAGIEITYDGGSISGGVTVTPFSPFADSGAGGVAMAAAYDNTVSLSGAWAYKWVQFVTSNYPLYSANPNLDAWGFYPESRLGISDRASRPYDKLISGELDTIEWSADAY